MTSRSPFRSVLMLSIYMTVGFALSGCLGSGDEDCEYDFGTFILSAHPLSTTCTLHPQFERVPIERGTTEQRTTGGHHSTTDIYSLGCELRITHSENSPFVEGGTEYLDGIVQPVAGPTLLEGWAYFERKDAQGGVICSGEYYLSLTSLDEVNRKTVEQRGN